MVGGAVRDQKRRRGGADVVSELFELDSRAANLAPVWLKGPSGDTEPLFVWVHPTAAGVSLYLCLFGAASPPPAAAASCPDIRVWLRRHLSSGVPAPPGTPPPPFDSTTVRL